MAIPPRPITGTLTAWAAPYTIRRARGLIAGPDKPPKPAPILARPVLASTASDTNGFTREIASAPESSDAFAMGSMRATFGESFAINGRFESSRPHQVVHRAGKDPLRKDSAMLGVGTGDIQFVSSRPFYIFECPNDIDIVFNRVSEYVHKPRVGIWRSAGILSVMKARTPMF